MRSREKRKKTKTTEKKKHGSEKEIQERKTERKPGTSSIIWKINRNIQWNRLKKFLFWDLIFVALAIVGICAAVEYQYGSRDFFQERIFSADGLYHQGWEWLRSVRYSILIRGRRQVIEAGVYAAVVLTAGGIAAGFQILGWLLDWNAWNQRLRHYMRPIDELALTAEKLSVQGIDESRIQNLEEAIDQIMGSETSVSIGDKDLLGLETAINNLLKRLQASYREQTRFVDDASHELRTPIAVIQGYASMLQRWGMDDRATLEEAVSAISEESEHMKELVDQLLFLARGDGGRQPFHEKEIDAGELLKEICEESEMIDQEHCYQLKKSCEVKISVDPAMMKQAVRILVDNAVKYTPKGGTITLRLERASDGRIGLGVQDEGIGMEAQETAHMFERFFRGDRVRGNTKGSGLGLSIAKWIVDKHRGTIEVLSFRNIGTRMTILLPVK